MKVLLIALALVFGFFEGRIFAQTQSSAPRSEEIPMDDIEEDDDIVSEESEVIEEPVAKIKSKSKQKKSQLTASKAKDVDGTRALDRGEFETPTLGMSHYKRNGVALEVDPD